MHICLSNEFVPFIGTLFDKMAANDNPNVPELEQQMGGEEYYNRELFVSLKCHQLNDCLASKNMIKERGILLDKLQEKMPGFYG